jgi:rifampicin phosphotransferase
LEEAYRQATGSVDGREVYNLLQGVMNMSLETDRGLWLLAEQAKASETLLTILTDSKEPFETLGATTEGREFLKDLLAFLNIYGHWTASTH